MATFIDLSGRSATALSLRIRGAVVAIVVVVAGVILHQNIQKNGAENFVLTVNMPSSMAAVTPGSEVKFRGLTIGKVHAVTSVSDQNQKIELRINRNQAKNLTDDSKAHLVASTIFGTSAVELMSQGQGMTLKDGGQVEAAVDVADVTMSGFLRESGKLTNIIDSEESQILLEFLNKYGSLVGPSIESFFTLADIARNSGQTSVTQNAIDAASIISDSTILSSLPVGFDEFLDAASFLTIPGGVERTLAGTEGLSKFLREIGNLVKRYRPDVLEILRPIFDVASPAVNTLRGTDPLNTKVSQLLNKLKRAFIIDEDNLQLQVQIIVSHMPQIVTLLDDGGK
ncbi:MAG: MlaD family protein [Mycobacteriaceae bacterium]